MLLNVRKLLDIPNDGQTTFVEFRTGARTRAVLATAAGIPNRFATQSNRVVVKVYKGDGSSSGSRQYQDYHQRWFPAIEALTANRHVQQSLESGVFSGVGPYAVLGFIDGEELADRLARADLHRSDATRILREILLEIWIPLWHAGLRFKDCHPGNFVLTPTGETVMIDTEQMRKDADELLHRPQDWEQRILHEEQGLRRLPKLVQRVVCAARPPASDSAVLRVVKNALTDAGLPQALADLGRIDTDQHRARVAAIRFLILLAGEGLIE